ncbi:metallophosphoesterase [Acinetobacter baumannii]
MIQVLNNKRRGKLYAVGDLHGCYNLLMNRLKEIGFDFDRDLLISVGDLVDRGPNSKECAELLWEDWFKAVLGNHELLCIEGLSDPVKKKCHLLNGGQWFYELKEFDQHMFVAAFRKMPTVLEVHHKGKKYGFVHGNIEENDWEQFKATFSQEDNTSIRSAQQQALWGRTRVDRHNPGYEEVKNIDYVFLGHTMVFNAFRRDNCVFIDTGAYHTGKLTIIDLG